MAYPEGEVIAGVDEGELEGVEELVQLGQAGERPARPSLWPAGIGWLLPLVLGAGVGAGLMYFGTAKDDGGYEDGAW